MSDKIGLAVVMTERVGIEEILFVEMGSGYHRSFAKMYPCNKEDDARLLRYFGGLKEMHDTVSDIILMLDAAAVKDEEPEGRELWEQFDLLSNQYKALEWRLI